MCPVLLYSISEVANDSTSVFHHHVNVNLTVLIPDTLTWVSLLFVLPKIVCMPLNKRVGNEAIRQ